MRHATSFNTLAIIVTLSSAAATCVCGCSDHIVVGDQGLTDAGTKTDGSTTPSTSPNPNPETDTKSSPSLTKVAPFAIGCGEQHDLMPAVSPRVTSRQVVPDAYACEIAVDAASAVVMACASSNPATVGVEALPAGQSKQLFVQKRAANGSVIFNTPIAGLAALDIATSAAGDTFVLGAMSPATDKDPAFALVKLTPSGAVDWSKKFYKMYDTTLAHGALAVASDGSVWVTGSTNFVAAQFDGLGNELQRISMLSDGNPGWGGAQAIRILANGDILVAGSINRPIDLGGGTLGLASDVLSSGFLARYTASGQHVASQLFSQAGGVQSLGLAVGPDNSIVLTGNLNGQRSIFECVTTSAFAPGFVAKLDDALTVQWTTLIPAGVGTPEVDAVGNIVVASKTPDNVYLVRLDPAGNAGTAWWTFAGAAAGYRVALAPNGVTYVSGSFLRSVSFDETPLTTIDDSSAGFIVGLAP